MSPSLMGEPAPHGYRAEAPASKVPQLRAAAGLGEDKSEAGQRAPVSQRRESSHRSARPGSSIPSRRSSLEPRATQGHWAQSGYEGRGPAGLDPSSKKIRKNWRSPKLRRRACPRQSSKGGGDRPGRIPRELMRRLGKSKSSHFPPRVYDVFSPFISSGQCAQPP